MGVNRIRWRFLCRQIRWGLPFSFTHLAILPFLHCNPSDIEFGSARALRGRFFPWGNSRVALTRGHCYLTPSRTWFLMLSKQTLNFQHLFLCCWPVILWFWVFNNGLRGDGFLSRRCVCTKRKRDNGSWQKITTMLETRGCQWLVYPQNTTSATGEQTKFASSLIVLLLIYKSAWKCRGGERRTASGLRPNHTPQVKLVLPCRNRPHVYSYHGWLYSYHGWQQSRGACDHSPSSNRRYQPHW